MTSAITRQSTRPSARWLISIVSSPLLTERESVFELGEYSGKLVLSTHLDRDPCRVAGKIELRADDGMIVEVD